MGARRTFIGVLVVASLVTALTTTGAVAAEAKSRVGMQVDTFTLKDFRGTEHSLDELSDKPVVVLAILGVECPLAKLYAPRLQKMADRFESQGVAFIGINSNRQDSITELAAYARIHDIRFPLLKDAGNVVADAIGATRTPEMFVLDADRVVRYHGRIDDQYGYRGPRSYQKTAPERNDLEIAIEELLAGEGVSVASTEALGCIIGRVRSVDAAAEVTYANQISRIMNAHCVECHRDGEIAPFSLTSYDETVGWGEMIAEVVQDQRMPPWHADPAYGHFSNDIRLLDEEKEQIYAWVDAGCPEGDVSNLPEPPQFTEGWQLPRKPDLVIQVRDEPVSVPAEGVVEYQYYEVDPGFTEDKWVQVAEAMPGNRRVVHHIIAFIRPPKQEKRSSDRDARGFHFLAGFAPGTRPFLFPDGMAKKIPAGSKIIFQMHYTPCGSEQEDLSSVGLIFADPETVTHQVATTNAATHLFEIPPHAHNHKVEAWRKFHRDTLVLSLFPHMHLRGKSFRYEAVYPDGTTEILLDVPKYDFNWQNHFIFSEPKLMPKGTKMFCTAHFDNSEDNLSNPDPTEAVRWGDQTWEEMMIGWYDVAMPLATADEIIERAAEEAAEAETADAENSGD